MGLKEHVDITWLAVSFGSLRRKSTKDDPKAVVRELKDKSTVYERIYDEVSGVLERVTFNEHAEYGNSWNLIIKDGQQIYGIRIQENSRYGVDFMKKFPNLRKDCNYAFKPYEYEKNNKPQVGIWISNSITLDKIQSFYQNFKQNDDKTWTITNLHGYPEFDVPFDEKKGKYNEAKMKIYFIELTEFLRERALALLKSTFLESESSAIGDTSGDPEEAPLGEPPAKDDLPF